MKPTVFTPKQWMETIEVLMSDQDKIDIGPKIYDLHQEIKSDEETAKAANKAAKAAIDIKKGVFDLLCSQANRGVREQAVMMQEGPPDQVSNSVTITRVDTGEVVRTRQLTAEEIQPSMFGSPEEKMAN